MATFNTAFGALPSVKTLTGRETGRARSRQAQDGTEYQSEYGGSQQLQAQMQAQQEAQQRQMRQPGAGQTMPTFSDLQRQGRARPAPVAQPLAQPMGMPQAAQAAQPSPMLASLAEQFKAELPPMAAALAPSAAPAAAPAPGAMQAQLQQMLGMAPAAAPVAPAAPAPMAEPMGMPMAATAAAPAAAPAEAPASAPGGEAEGADGLNRAPTDGEFADGSAQRPYNPNDPPPANAPVGALYRVNQYMTIQRLPDGTWGVPGTPGSTHAQLLRTAEQQRYDADYNVDRRQLQTLAPGIGVVFEPGRGYRLRTLAEVNADRAQRGWPPYTESEYLGSNMDILTMPGVDRLGLLTPEMRRRQQELGIRWEGEGLNRQRFSPAVEPPAGGAPPRTADMPQADGGFTPPTGLTPDFLLPPTIPVTRMPTGAPPASGVPAGAPLPPVAVASQQGGELMQMLREQLGQLARGATSEEQRAFDAMREARRAELEAQFGGQQRALDEEMAARGLYASSIGAGRLGDLRGQQARALASLEAEVLGKQAEMAAERQRALITGLQGATATQADIDIRAAQLQQDALLRGRELDIQSARDIAANQLGYAEIGSRERIAQAEVNQRAQQLQQEARLRGRELDLQSARDIAANQLGYAELTSREKISGAELAARERIANLDRELQRTLGMGGLGINRGSLMLQLYDAIGKSNIPPEAIDDIFRLLGLTPPPRTPVGTPGGTPGGPGTPGGNEDLNNPLTWRAGTYDGEPRATTDGRNFRWSVARGRWEQQTTLFG